jgi:membrane protein
MVIAQREPQAHEFRGGVLKDRLCVVHEQGPLAFAGDSMQPALSTRRLQRWPERWRPRRRPMWALLTRAVNDWFRHKSARLGAALAYYSVFSLGPLLLIVTAVAGLFFGADAVRSSITSQFRSMLGETGSQAVEVMLKGAESATAGGWTAVFGIGLLIVAALGVVVQLRDALNTIFEVKEPDDAGVAWYAKVYGMSFAGILALGFLLAVALVISAGLAAFSSWFGGSPAESALLALMNFAVSLAVLTLLFSMLFKWLPDTHLSWSTYGWAGSSRRFCSISASPQSAGT